MDTSFVFDLVLAVGELSNKSELILLDNKRVLIVYAAVTVDVSLLFSEFLDTERALAHVVLVRVCGNLHNEYSVCDIYETVTVCIAA